MTQNLNLKNCVNITNNGLKYLINMRSRLNLNGCTNISDAGLQNILNTITLLDLYGTNVTDEGCKYYMFDNLHNLKHRRDMMHTYK
jgi:hypothetical protein